MIVSAKKAVGKKRFLQLAKCNELFNDLRIKNRGISGDVTAGVINRIDEIVERKPARIFSLIGTNDLARKISADSVLKNIFFIVEYLQQEIPTTKIFVQSILPVNSSFGKFAGHTANGDVIRQVNTVLKDKASIQHYTFIDLHTAFADANGNLKKGSK